MNAEAFRLKDLFRDVTPLRADGQGRSIRQKGQPLEPQDAHALFSDLVQVTLVSDALERSVRLRVSAAALRSVEHRGGLDDFLVKAHKSDLSEDAVKLKREIAKKRAELKSEAA